MTPAQHRALEAVRDGRVFCWRDGRVVTDVRRDVFERVVSYGWVSVPGHAPLVKAVLTDAGREALGATLAVEEA